MPGLWGIQAPLIKISVSGAIWACADALSKHTHNRAPCRELRVREAFYEIDLRCVLTIASGAQQTAAFQADLRQQECIGHSEKLSKEGATLSLSVSAKAS